MKEDYDTKFMRVNADLKKIWNSNLFVPDIIGTNPKTFKYRNLADCITDFNKKIEASETKLGPFVKEVVDKAETKIKM